MFDIRSKRQMYSAKSDGLSISLVHLPKNTRKPTKIQPSLKPKDLRLAGPADSQEIPMSIKDRRRPPTLRHVLARRPSKVKVQRLAVSTAELQLRHESNSGAFDIDHWASARPGTRRHFLKNVHNLRQGFLSLLSREFYKFYKSSKVAWLTLAPYQVKFSVIYVKRWLYLTIFLK